MGKQVVITGASRGIGFETARILADLGHSVIAVSRSEDGLKKLQSTSAGRIIPLSLDLTRPDSVQRIIDLILKETGGVDALIHNAGLLINKPFPELTDSDWMDQWQLNVMIPVRLTRELLPNLNPEAHIVNIGSMGGFQGSSKFPGLSAYSVTKGALSILTECLSAELASQKVSVNCLCLGAVQTEMLEQAFPGYQAPLNPGEMGEFIANFTLNGHQFINGKILPVALNNPG